MAFIKDKLSVFADTINLSLNGALSLSFICPHSKAFEKEIAKRKKSVFMIINLAENNIPKLQINLIKQLQ
jgi:hypothetical protein